MAGETPLNGELLSNLGRKARERLTQERSKRPEIVRIGDGPSEVQHQSATFIIPPKKLKGTSDRVRKIKRKSTVDDKDVDRWLPSLAHMPKCSTESRSRLVQLHGLPLWTTAGKVRRFFVGLNPERILVLPTRLDQKRISQLDALDSNPRKRGGIFVKRHPSDFRVFVLFDAAPTAALAVDRSGEVMSADDDAPQRGASIGITMVPKPIASHFLKHMTVDAKGLLNERLQEIERSLDPKINDILWQKADVELKFELSDKDVKRSFTSLLFINPNLSGYNKLKTQRDRLVDELESLRYQVPFPSCSLFDPSLDVDPIIRLSVSAAKTLECEIERIDAQLLLLQRLSVYFSDLNKSKENSETADQDL